MRLPIPSWLIRPVYFLLINVLFPLILLLVWPLLLLKEKRRKTLLPRLGFQPFPSFKPGRPRPVWLHALSVGELVSALPLIDALRSRLGDRPLVVSVSTLAAHRLATKRLKDRADGLFYFPYETALAYRRCLARIRPALFVLIETDVWPGTLGWFSRQGVRSILINGRLSDRTLRSQRRWWSLFQSAYDAFEMISGQSAGENQRYLDLGIRPEQLGVPGNLKFDALAVGASKGGGDALRRILGFTPGDRIVIAGSTHAGEEIAVLVAFRALRVSFPELKLLLVPRHPERAEDVYDLVLDSNFKAARLTDMETWEPDVVVINRIGYLSRLYPVAEAAFVGGSLVRKGGQNPIEPAMAAKPIVFGPDMRDFPEIAPDLLAAGGAVTVKDSEGIRKQWQAWLDDPALGAKTGSLARATVAKHQGAAERLANDLIERFALSSESPAP